MKHFVLLIFLCLFSVSIMGEAPTDSLGGQGGSKPDTTAAAGEGKADSEKSCQNTSKRQEAQADWLPLASSCVSIVALAGMVIMSFRLKRESGKRRQLKRELDQLKQASLSQKQVDARKIQDEAERRWSRSLRGLEERVGSVEAKLKAVGRQSPMEKGSPKIKYFGINSEDYFVRAFDTSDVDKLFKVTFDDVSLNKGEFELIDLNRIKSADQIGHVIQFTDGSKKINDAQKVISQVKGTVVRDGNLWKVVEKLKLKLN